MSEKLLPDLFYAIAFAAAHWDSSNGICYAAEERTGLHFYVWSTELHNLLSKGDKKNSALTIPFVIKRVKKFFFFNYLKAFDESGKEIGRFYDVAGGGPTGDFFNDVARAH